MMRADSLALSVERQYFFEW